MPFCNVTDHLNSSDELSPAHARAHMATANQVMASIAEASGNVGERVVEDEIFAGAEDEVGGGEGELLGRAQICTPRVIATVILTSNLLKFHLTPHPNPLKLHLILS